ncbi:MAG: AI-2E family transporter [Polyangiaceae bacterium]
MDDVEKRSAVRLLVMLAGVLVVGAVATFWPLAPALFLSLWFAMLARPVLVKLNRRLGGRERAAAMLTVALVVAFLVPVVIVVVSLTGATVTLVRSVLASKTGRNALESIVASNDGEAPLTVERVIGLAREHGEKAWSLAMDVLGATATVSLLVFVFLIGVYSFLVDGPEAYEWLADRVPLPRRELDRFAGAFEETGRGLLVGVGLTAIAQGALATVTYFVLGIPRAFVLGFLTACAALIPSFGTAIVWVPVALGLGLTGRPGAAIAMAIVGTLVIGSVDNLLRPMFARYGNLKLPAFVVTVSMFGGLATFGGLGLLLGPLVARLLKEVLDIGRDRRLERLAMK